MGFLKRVFSGVAPQPERAWFDVRSGGYFEIAGVQHHKDDVARVIPYAQAGQEPQVYDDVAVTLHRDPGNRYDANAVEVRLSGRLVGYIPRDYAAAWTAFVARVEAEGFGVRVMARIRAYEHAFYINLRALEDASERTPSEEAIFEAERWKRDGDRRPVGRGEQDHSGT